MPVTRSSSRQNSQQPSIQPYQARTTARAGSSNKSESKKSAKRAPGRGPEIIVLSSDEDEPQRKPSSKPRKKRAGNAAPVLSGEILELSSEDERQSTSNPPRKNHSQSSDAAQRDAQRTIKKLREELKGAERRAALACSEVEQLKRETSLRSTNKVLSELEEYTSCEVCTLTILNPYVLPECGHSFCEDCLVDWFSRAHALHLTANPNVDGNRAALGGQMRAILHTIPNLYTFLGPHVHNHLQTLLREARRMRPEYTCPSCRKEVETRPVADFRLKGLVKEIATLSGETSARDRDSLPRDHGPFDHFFPAPVTGR